MSKKNQRTSDDKDQVLPGDVVPGARTEPEQGEGQGNQTPAEGESQDLGNLGARTEPEQSSDLGGLNEPVSDTVDLGKLKPLPKFKKFNNQKKEG